MEDASLSLSVWNVDGGGQLVRVAGEVDMATAPDLAQLLAQLIEGDVHVDLGGVTYLDSSGLGCLIRAQSAVEARGKQFVLHGASPMLVRLFSAAGLTSFFHLDGKAPTPENELGEPRLSVHQAICDPPRPR